MRIPVRIIRGLVNNLAKVFEASAIVLHMTENCHALRSHVPIHPPNGFPGIYDLKKKGNSLAELHSGSPSRNYDIKVAPLPQA